MAIQNLFVVQYNFAGTNDGSEPPEDQWITDQDYRFGFDPTDAKSKLLAEAAARACMAWSQYEDMMGHDECEHGHIELPYRIVHRIMSDEKV